MINRRWDATVANEHLFVRRRRFLPWSKPEVRSIPLAAIRDVRSLSASDQRQLCAQVTIHHPAPPHLAGVYKVRFTPESWAQLANVLARRAAATEPRPPVAEPTRPAPVPRLPASTSRPAPVRSTPAPMGEGARLVWLWKANGKIHGSLAPAGGASPRRLDRAGLARLLLAEPTRSLPAIRALTGLDDDTLALARMRGWQRADTRVVELGAADGAGRQTTPLHRPAAVHPDGSIRTVSGGLPSLGKRHS
ncbi:hypothetical protein AB0J74_11400 [Asanoa sp. NPDC049573]|uniref:hypothetical protein n=1 Tax=Asanoa sp. NPDC049573 TaxID=3155396 RepID=UPI00343D3CBF